ncbi:MAG: DUF3006 domain-containing protein [bacterium]
MNGKEERTWVIDRIESGIAVLIADEDQRILETDLNSLPPSSRDGSVLRVTESRGEPLWSSAVLDEDLRAKRLESTQVVLNDFRKRDPGGDVVL